MLGAITGASRSAACHLACNARFIARQAKPGYRRFDMWVRQSGFPDRYACGLRIAVRHASSYGRGRYSQAGERAKGIDKPDSSPALPDREEILDAIAHNRHPLSPFKPSHVDSEKK